MGRLLIKFPSRNRPQKFQSVLTLYATKLSGNHEARFVISMDEDDSTMNTPEMRHWLDDFSKTVDLSYHYGNSASKIEACNADLDGENADVLLLASDDMIPIAESYDDIIFSIFAAKFPDFDGAIKFWDGNRGLSDPLMTLAVLGFPLYKRFGYIYHPSYKSVYCDDEQTAVCRRIGRLAVSELCIIRHEWGTNPSDQLHRRNESPKMYSVDHQVFKERRARNFDIESLLANDPGKNIIITGAHRSGTTWTGSVISSAPGVHLVDEPFNPSKESPFSLWFTHLDENSPPERLERINSYLDRVALNRRACIKDPIAIMSVEWLAEKLDADVVFMVRHPAAFVGSIKKKQWAHPFDHFEKQESLMSTLPPALVEQIEKFSKEKQDIIDQAILLWNIVYYRMANYMQIDNPRWHFVRHEDLALDPLDLFGQLFKKLDLPFTPAVVNHIAKTTAPNGKHPLSRNSKKVVHNWKKRLTPEEITRVREGTAEIFQLYYSEEEWA